MIKTENRYEFESTGRVMITHGNDWLSVYMGVVMYGYDGYPYFLDKDGEPEYDRTEITDEEKKELAEYMIQQWKEFGRIN